MIFPVVLACDRPYFPHAATTIYSLLRNGNITSSRIILITASIDNRERNNFKRLCADFDMQFDIIICDSDRIRKLPVHFHFNYTVFYRLYIADLIEDQYCLYLDSDLIVCDDISFLFSINLNEHLVAAVINPGYSNYELIGLKQESDYFNSGVMLINLKKWRSINLASKVLKLIEENGDRWLFSDQDGLNSLIDGQWLRLSEEFNFQKKMFSMKPAFVSTSPKIIHFTGKSKPWHLNDTHPYKYLYWQSRNKTPFITWFNYEFTVIDLLKYLTPKLLKNFLRKIFANRSTG